MDLVIRNARLRGEKELVDITVTRGGIESVGPRLAGTAREDIDAGGCLVSPGFVNLHLHADKSLLGERMRPNVSGTLPEAIEITNEFKRAYEPEEVARRAGRVLEAGVQNGTTFFRLFADVGTIGGLRAAQGLLLPPERLQKYCRVQVVAFPQEGIARGPGAAELLEEAVEQGCDILGRPARDEYTDADAPAHINLVCSARLDREPRRRGIARVKELLARGANVISSQDDVNDPYYPFGKPDPLECASMIAHVAQLTLPHELEQAIDMVTVNAAKAARLADYGIAPGCRADLVV